MNPTTTTVQLKRGDIPFAFRDITIPAQPPATPSEWFTRRFPAETKLWGCPFLEEVVEDVETGRKRITAVSMNCSFLAAALSDSQLGHSVVFYEPEQQWFYLEPRDGQYHPTSEPKLMTLLSALLVRCAEEMPVNVDRANLFVKFREDDQLRSIVKQARSILEADSTFFSINSPYIRVEGKEQHGRLARQFIGQAVRPQPGQLLSITDCYAGFEGFCRNNGVEPVARKQFRQLVVDIIREEFGLGLRADLKNAQGRFQRGWKGLTVEVDARN
ncbi:MAG: hypothetical protein WCS99_09405 [Limisphaerales bacterium]